MLRTARLRTVLMCVTQKTKAKMRVAVFCTLYAFIIFFNINMLKATIRDEGNLHGSPLKNGAADAVVESLCGPSATRRGHHQKVVSYSFFGPLGQSNYRMYKRWYINGIESHAKTLQEFYPGWVMRVYHEISPDNVNGTTFMENLDLKYPHLDFCYAGNIPNLGNITSKEGGDDERTVWRYLPLGDPLVDVFASRDLDTPFSYREKSAVEEWMEDKRTFHAMRDHSGHCDYIMAGLWGAKVYQRRDMLHQVLDKFVKAIRTNGRRGIDQRLLEKILKPHIGEDIVQHDSYKCDIHPGSQPWPAKRAINDTVPFVGIGVASEDMIVSPSVRAAECPEICRPPNHMDWTYC